MSDEQDAAQLAYDRKKFGVNRQDLDAMGDRAVRDALNSGKYGHAGLSPFDFVTAWLADKEFLRQVSTSKWARHAAYAAYIAAAIAAMSIAITIIIAVLN